LPICQNANIYSLGKWKAISFQNHVKTAHGLPGTKELIFCNACSNFIIIPDFFSCSRWASYFWNRCWPARVILILVDLFIINWLDLKTCLTIHLSCTESHRRELIKFLDRLFSISSLTFRLLIKYLLSNKILGNLKITKCIYLQSSTKPNGYQFDDPLVVDFAMCTLLLSGRKYCHGYGSPFLT
jgi:hypothetical protein